MTSLLHQVSPVVWLDGTLVPAEDPRLPSWNRGIAIADGLYETFRTYEGHALDLPALEQLMGEHLKRLADGCRFLHLEMPPLLPAGCMTAMEANGLAGRDARIRIVLWRRGSRIGHAGPDPVHAACYALPVNQGELDGRRTAGLSVITLSPTRVPGDRFHNRKHMSNLPALLARIRCETEGVDDALYLNSRGEICEAVWSNVFVLDGDQKTLLTPPVDSPCLPGVTRRRVLELGAENGFQIREAPLTPGMITNAAEVFATSSVSEIMPIVRLNGTAVGSGNPGPVAALLQSAYRAGMTSRSPAS